jgi:hypothetical protein
MRRGLAGDRRRPRVARWLLPMAILLSVVAWSGGLARVGTAGERGAGASVAIQMRSDPPQELILPGVKPAQLIFKASMDNKSLDSGRLTVQVRAPPRPVWLSMPYPGIGGTTLLELVSDLRDGTFAVEYLFPTHGIYGFDLLIAPVASGTAARPTAIHYSLHVPADPASLSRDWLYSLALFALGGLAGVWCARKAQARKISPPRAAVLVGALIIGGLAAVTGSRALADHGPREVTLPRGPQVVQGPDGWALEIRPSPERAVVGELLDLTVTLTREGRVYPGATDVALHVYNLEDDRTVLRTNVRAPHGSTSQRLQLVASVPHSCTVNASPAGLPSETPVTLTAVIGVNVADAPTSVTAWLRVLGLGLVVVGAGVLGGFLLASGAHRLPRRVER